MDAGTATEERVEERTRLAPRWNVLLLDDDDHSYPYVVEMLGRVFGHAPGKAYRLAQEVDASGRVIVWTGSLEVAELKQEQVHAYGADPRIQRSAGSMTAVVEPT